MASLTSPICGCGWLGRPSIDPELLIGMLLIGYCFGIGPERRLCEEVHLNLAYRWFVGSASMVRCPITRPSLRTGMGVSARVICCAACSRRWCAAASGKVWSAVASKVTPKFISPADPAALDRRSRRTGLLRLLPARPSGDAARATAAIGVGQRPPSHRPVRS